MSMINGIGTAFFGCSEPCSDGSYIATKWLCLGFPIVPLGSYRLWLEDHKKSILWGYSSSTFRAKRIGFYLPQIFGIYKWYFALYWFIVIANRIGSGEWKFT